MASGLSFPRRALEVCLPLRPQHLVKKIGIYRQKEGVSICCLYPWGWGGCVPKITTYLIVTAPWAPGTNPTPRTRQWRRRPLGYSCKHWVTRCKNPGTRRGWQLPSRRCWLWRAASEQRWYPAGARPVGEVQGWR